MAGWEKVCIIFEDEESPPQEWRIVIGPRGEIVSLCRLVDLPLIPTLEPRNAPLEPKPLP